MIYENLTIPTIVLSTKDHRHLGRIRMVQENTININENMNSAQEISFDVHKEVDGEVEPLWDDIVSMKYIYIPQTSYMPANYYSIVVTVDDTNETVKHVTGTSACEFELSKRMLYDFGVNNSDDIANQAAEWKLAHPDKHDVPDFIPSLFYNPEDTEHSLLHRVLHDKCPDYSIGDVQPSSLRRKQRSFSANSQDIYGFLTGTVAKELDCIFKFDSVNRTVSAYSLRYVCDDCDNTVDVVNQCPNYGEPATVCPNCGSTHYHSYFGESTNIFISAENYADQISCSDNSDNVYNCLRVNGGDQLITSAIRYINPTGDQYIYRFSQDMFDDMPDELEQKILDYQAFYAENLDDAEAATLAYYTEMAKLSNLQHGVPSMSPMNTTAAEQALLLHNDDTSHPGKMDQHRQSDNYIVANIEAITVLDTSPYTIANNAVKGMAEAYADCRYKVEATGTVISQGQSTVRVWEGKVKLTNKGNEEDYAETTTFRVGIRKKMDIADFESAADVTNYDHYLQQRILKRLERDDLMFKDVYAIDTLSAFRTEIQRTHADGDLQGQPIYGKAILEAFATSYETCLNILVENNVTDENADFYGVDLYGELYEPFRDRLTILNTEIANRDAQIEASQTLVNARKDELNAIHDSMNFQKYLGNDLFTVFSHYRMESDYTNSNYVSDGLNDTELLDNAKTLFKAAQEEVVRASELQYTLSCSLNNLLQDRNFSGYVEKFKINNWLVMRSDSHNYLLRLTNIGIDFGNLEDISVTFSNALRINGVVDDVQSILSQATGMASTYDTVMHQAEQGSTVNRQVQNVLQDGLDASMTILKNNNTEEVLFDQNGIILKSYNDILEDYDPYQCRLTHNVMAFTKDNWETCALAIGESVFAKYEETSPGNGKIYTNNSGYGVVAEYVTAGYVYGSQIIAGDLYSQNYRKVTIDDRVRQFGTHIDLNNGEFSIADGQIRFENNSLIIELGGKDLNDAVENVEILYAKNTDPDNPPDPESSTAWHSTMPARDEGEYLWQKTTTTYFNKDPEVSIVNITGIDGEQGHDGRSVDHIDVGYNFSAASTTRPSTYPYARPEDVSVPDGNYLWKRTIYYDQDDQIIKTTYEYTKQGSKGDKGDKGDEGDPGTGVTTVVSQYAIRKGDTSDAAYYSNPQWQDKMPDYDSTCYTYKYYYWGRDKITYDDGTPTKYTDPVVLYGTTTSARVSYDAKKLADEMGEQTVLSVGSGNRMVTMQLKSSPSEGSEFKVGANNISLTADQAISLMAGGTINMTSKDISITTTSGNFSVTPAGVLSCSGATVSGAITATSLTLTGDASVPWSKIDGKPDIPQDISLYIKQDGTVGDEPAEGATGFKVEHTGTMKASNAIVYGELYSSVGRIGGWTLANKSLYSSVGGSYDVTPLTANDFARYDTYQGYPRWRSGSTTYHVDGATARATISFSGYTKFVVYIRSEAESNYDYTVAGQLDATNIGRSTSSAQGHTYGKQSQDIKVEYSNLDGGAHTIEIIYTKDNSQSVDPDCGYFYVDEQSCVSTGGLFRLSVQDFSSSIGGTTRTGLRLSINNNFAVDKAGRMYAAAGEIGGWLIESDRLKSTGTGDYSQYTVGLFSKSDATSGSYAMAITKTGDVQWGVRYNGNMTVNEMVTNGWTIKQKEIYSGSFNANNTSSSFHPDGIRFDTADMQYGMLCGTNYVGSSDKETGYHLININKRINGSMNYMGTYGIRSFKIDNSYVYGGMSLYASNGQHNPANGNPLRELSLSPEADGAIDFKVSGNTVFQVKSDLVKHTGTGAFGDVKIMSGSSGIYGDLVVATLDSDRTYTFPNKTGTVALLSDIPTVPSLGWTQLGSFSGTSSYTISSTNRTKYNEFMVVGRSYSSSTDLKRVSVLIPKAEFTNNTVEWWLGGGVSSGGSGLRGVVSVKSTSDTSSVVITGVNFSIGTNDKTSVTTWYVYAR